MEAKTFDEKAILLKELDNKNIDFASFFLGFSEDIEKSIIKYINNCAGVVVRAELINYIVYLNEICSIKRLDRLLDSLIKHDYIEQVVETKTFGKYKKTIIYYILK